MSMVYGGIGDQLPLVVIKAYRSVWENRILEVFMLEKSSGVGEVILIEIGMRLVIIVSVGDIEVALEVWRVGVWAMNLWDNRVCGEVVEEILGRGNFMWVEFKVSVSVWEFSRNLERRRVLMVGVVIRAKVLERYEGIVWRSDIFTLCEVSWGESTESNLVIVSSLESYSRVDIVREGATELTKAVSDSIQIDKEERLCFINISISIDSHLGVTHTRVRTVLCSSEMIYFYRNECWRSVGDADWEDGEECYSNTEEAVVMVGGDGDERYMSGTCEWRIQSLVYEWSIGRPSQRAVYGCGSDLLVYQVDSSADVHGDTMSTKGIQDFVLVLEVRGDDHRQCLQCALTLRVVTLLTDMCSIVLYSITYNIFDYVLGAI
ncbi:hypothetical protein Tco_0989480 [Tanacetum coccineum]|uniref:Uncharacterized protein n=1 Tax=Tanacetum coccineum TaxID=301880 RepID=A0ABQ5ETS2_9ASTR